MDFEKSDPNPIRCHPSPTHEGTTSFNWIHSHLFFRLKRHIFMKYESMSPCFLSLGSMF